MGSSDQICVLSGMPIKEGDRVKGQIIFSNPRGTRNSRYVMDDPIPLGFPITGTYNGSGGIENLDTSPSLNFLKERLSLSNLKELREPDEDFPEITTRQHVFIGEEEQATWKDFPLECHLVFMREDVYEFLSNNDFMDWCDDRPSFYKAAKSCYKTFLKDLETRLTEPESDVVTELMVSTFDIIGFKTLHIFLESPDSVSSFTEMFSVSREHDGFGQELKIYEDWIWDKAKKGEASGDPEVDKLCQEMIQFRQVTWNMTVLGLTFASRAWGSQVKHYSSHIPYLEFLLDKAKKESASE